MRMVGSILLGLVGLASVAWVGLWLWGTWAFTPERMPMSLSCRVSCPAIWSIRSSVRRGFPHLESVGKPGPRRSHGKSLHSHHR